MKTHLQSLAMGMGVLLVSLMQAQSNYPTKISSNSNFVIMQVPQNIFDGWKTAYYNTDFNEVSPITKQLYKTYNDDFDFIVFVIDQSSTDHQPTGMPYGMNVSVSNNIQGIGKSSFDNTAAYGSAGKLKSHLTLWSRTYMENGPFLHEFCHNWANSVIDENEFSQENYDYAMCGAANADVCATKTTLGHWGFAGCGGQLGGFDQTTLKTNVDGNPNKYQASISGGQSFGFNANGGNALPYSQFELYLMGMIPLSSVPTFDAFTGVTLLSADLTAGAGGKWNGKFVATTRKTYTNAKITTDFGARVPSSVTAQKDFKALVVLLTTSAVDAVSSVSLTDVDGQLTRMSKKADNGNFLYNFWEATGGLGSMSFDLSGSITSVVNTGEYNNLITLYPNPSSGEDIFITLNDKLQESNSIKVSLMDVSGREILSVLSINNESGMIKFSTGSLGSGIYFVQVNDLNSNLMVTHKLVLR